MKGRASSTSNLTMHAKWTKIQSTINTKRIVILAIQETHLNAATADDLGRFFTKRLLIHNSPDPDRPGASAGVAFVLNKDIIVTDDYTITDLVPRRATMLSIDWHGSGCITLLNIYAPNDPKKHPKFWLDIETARTTAGLPRPNFLLGDFNLVEDALDRAPAHVDDKNTVKALVDFRTHLTLQDTWRHLNPDTKLFTFRGHHGSNYAKSRIDRIYTTTAQVENVFEWHSGLTSVPTDHAIVTVRFAPHDVPDTGKGRWMTPIYITNNDKFMQQLMQHGMILEQEMKSIEGSRTNSKNPQTLWTKFKNKLRQAIRDHTRQDLGKMQTKINKLQEDVDKLTQNPDFATNHDLRKQEQMLVAEIQHLENKRRANARNTAKARYHLQGKEMNKYWTGLNKTKKHRDIIKCLRIRDLNNPDAPPRYEKHFKRMAALARSYHDDLQSQGRDATRTPDEAHLNTEAVINSIPDDQQLPNNANTHLDQLITRMDVEEALRTSKNGTATGVDGCPYELWKKMHELYTKALKTGEQAFDIVGTLTRVFNDIQTHQVTEGTDFSLGWMCPIYKKKDKTDIANYRPITLLNTDYKIFTKALATQLARTVHTMVHPNQAGFIPGRSIFDQTRLAQAMINFAEAMDENGAIVALDQEKAYDKIDHEYLWKTLKKYNLPDEFIRTVKSLYETAYTKVAINGFFSCPYKVTRGVRQGDPLSCLLFDLATELLACMLRASPKLRRFKIPGIAEKVLVSLFANDTAIFLSEYDRYDDLTDILEKWCAASGAKFNINKTEIIPIGSIDHRRRILETRKIHPDDNGQLIDGINVATDGNPIRYLGRWIGNNVNNAQP
ncbi:hypothetical protein EWM64_g1481 [Hericium alpestre]|uniref:Reverse transcriptase domain-containing protein n=1 Tax=Hericium alpestre TaxID=135208 RepID=A0A4Z0A9D5_9AGAM|nr:hypothetical protein EWM64_g1481 [Hericium alpestre]